MTVNEILILALTGVLAGIVAGLFGVGGGIVIVPTLVFILGFTQHQAQGTALAIMVPPIGLLAATRYYMAGNVKISMALFICIGFFVGGLVGAHFAHKIPDLMLKRIFGTYLLYIAVRMVLGK